MTDLTVRDVMLPTDKIPVGKRTTLLKEALEKMSARRLGIACIVGDQGELCGIFTDGDIRRMLLRDQKPFPALFADDAIQHANKNPKTVFPDTSLVNAVQMMEDIEIWDLPVVDENRRLLGLLHLHPAIKALLKLV
ncbi:MAG: CBS domain-containing protein [Rhodospirillales bacterium]